MLLERFGHTSNRTRIIETSISPYGASLTVQHFAVDGGSTDALDNFFIWGFFTALLFRAGFETMSATLAGKSQDFSLFHDGIPQPLDNPPGDTATLQITWYPSARRSTHFDIAAEARPPVSATDSLESLFKRDLLRSWRLNEAARALHTSSRNLQRSLHRENTTFSETLQKTRVAAAEKLIRRHLLALTGKGQRICVSDIAGLEKQAPQIPA